MEATRKILCVGVNIVIQHVVFIIHKALKWKKNVLKHYYRFGLEMWI